MCPLPRQLRDGRRFLDNCCPEVVQPGGNRSAHRCLAGALDVVDATVCGVGVITASGFDLKPRLAAQNARELFPPREDPGRKPLDELQAGCDCSRVMPRKVCPDECRLYGLACTPRSPVRSCMVSDGGVCRI